MKKIILSFLLFLCISTFANLQAQGVSEAVDGKVSLLMERFVDGNKSKSTVTGWRIQIMATNDRQRMETALRQFENLYPSIHADWLHAKPYYKVRAGAFATKREALRTLYILKQDYPGAYPVQDNQIRPEELLR